MKKIILLLGLLVFIAACEPQPETPAIAGEPVTNEVPAPGSNAPETIVEPTTSSGQEQIVRIKGFKFVPAEITVKAGDTVTWINDDTAPHTATADSDEFDTDRLEEGEQASVTFDNTGDFAYFCNIHRGMRGTVTVE
ncbi:MAG TPA: cupredoxin family copper-binding protein [Candidatus Nanoarchaeia archaeon]|nr:cupredoxin family copper-binding protein [Candidatus Nanoarchaeia archaeon]